MWTSRKARGQPKETTTVTTRPLIFSNSISDDIIDTTTPPTSSSAENSNGFEYAPLDGFAKPAENYPTALPPYQEEQNGIASPQQTSTTPSLDLFLVTNTI